MPLHTLPRSAVLFFVLLALGLPSGLGAQLVREENPPAEPAAGKPDPAAGAPAGKRRVSQEVQLAGDQTWMDTGIAVKAGERLLITATGKLRYLDAKEENGPEGLGRGFRDLLRALPYNEAGRGAVLGRIGDLDVARPFLVGARRDVLAPVGGPLAVGINQGKDDPGDGTYAVRIEVYEADGAAARAATREVPSISGVDQALFSKIPRRISDKDGNPGDMVNFLILGSEEAMARVFTTSGWVKVDADVKDTVLHGILGSLSKEAYLTMPMSPLYLFKRPQDYGWAHAEPIAVVASRNHLRVWKAPFTADGLTVWVGAATHDIGFERDQRNNGVTHKIDPDIDLERDYVQKTLTSTGLVAEVAHFLPPNPMKEAKTATGGGFHSSGQVLILKLDETGKEPSPSVTAGETGKRKPS